MRSAYARSARRAALLVALVAPAGAASATEAEWAAALPPAAVAACLPPGPSAVLLTTAGMKDHPEAPPLVAAMASSLRASGRTRLVIDDGPLGDLDSLDDEARRARLATLPIDLLAVLRLGGAEGDVVSLQLLDRHGRPIATLSARRGVADVACRREARSAAANARPRPRRPSAPELDLPPGLLDKLIWFTTPNPGLAVDSMRPMQGLYDATPLPGRAFYDAIDRPDLGAEYHRRRVVQLSILLPGLLGAGAGLFLTGFSAGWSDHSEAGMITGGVMAISGGLVALIGGLSYSRAPISGDEAMQLAEQWNRRLKQRYGFDPDLPITRRSAPRPALQLLAAPSLLPGGGGLTLGGTF